MLNCFTFTNNLLDCKAIGLILHVVLPLDSLKLHQMLVDPAWRFVKPCQHSILLRYVTDIGDVQ